MLNIYGLGGITFNMVSVMNVIVGIFTTLGVLLVTGVILYLIAKAIGKRKPSKQNIFPGNDYMNYIGARCPANWTYAGSVRAGNTDMDVCFNQFNVPVFDAAACYDGDPSLRVKMFPKINDYDKYIKNNISQSQRCKWLNACGPPSPESLSSCGNSSDSPALSAPPAAWVGIAEHC